MKTLLLLLALSFVPGTILIAQAPQAFKYQAIARDKAGNILSNWEINLCVSIIQSEIDGEMVYMETHKVKSNIYGLLNLNIGEGDALKGEFEKIAWGENRYYIKLEMDISGEDWYQEMGTSQLYAVPYALYAEQAGSIAPHNRAQKNVKSGSSPPSQSFGGQSSGSRIVVPNSKFPATGDSYLNALEGKVGIGTDSPEYMLDVAGDINIADGSTFMIDEITVVHNKGTGNFFAGDSAGASSASTAGNTGFGYQALFSNTAGINNSAFGYKAGWNSLGSGNLFLGHKAGYYETGADKLYIDNSNTTKPLIYGDFSNDSLVVHGKQSIYQQNTAGKPNLFVSNVNGFVPNYQRGGTSGIISVVSSPDGYYNSAFDAWAIGNDIVHGIWSQAESLSDQLGSTAVGIYGSSITTGEAHSYGVRSQAVGKSAWGMSGLAYGTDEGCTLIGLSGNATGTGANSTAFGVIGEAFLEQPNCLVIGLYGGAFSSGGPSDSTWAGYFVQNVYANKIATGVTYKSPSAETQVHVRNTIDDNFGILVNAFDTLGSSIGLHTAKSKYAALVKNAYFDGGWYRFDESNGAFIQEIQPDGDVRFMVSPAGSGAVVWNKGIHLKNTGNVGINTDSPASRLTVYENDGNIAIHGIHTGTNGYAGYFEGPRNYFSGKVGIGNLSPSSEAKLHIRNSVSNNFGVLVDYNGTNGTEIGLHTAASKYAGLVKNAYYSTNWKRFDTGSGCFLQQIDPEGNLAIYLAPDGFEDITWTNVLNITYNGYVGVGNITPERTMHINNVLRLEPRSDPPSNPDRGDIYCGTDGYIHFYNGSNWYKLDMTLD